MPNFPNTPEALLGRSDSRNPATTCKGITSSGRPCRRALAASKISSIGTRRSSVGVVALVEEDGAVTDADFYCWQHKDQAEERVVQENNAGKRTKKRRSAELLPLKERSSIDTLVQRLGIEAIPEEGRRPKRKDKPNGGVRPPRGTETTDFADASHAARPSYGHNAEKYDYAPGRPSNRPPKTKKKTGFWASLCCMTDQDDDYVEIVRHRRRTQQQRPEVEEIRPPPPRVPHESRPSSASVPSRKPVATNQPGRPSDYRKSSNPQTGHLLSLIPQHCTPQTTSTLLAELIKPISAADEAGYIYIFWLTPQDKEAPAESTARSLLAPQERRPEAARRISDVMTEFSYDDHHQGSRSLGAGSRKKTIMLKIGRANNVTRRMNEWQRQCGYKLNLVRWYPYLPSSTTPSPGPSPARQPLYPDLNPSPQSRRQSDVVRKVPCVKRVERLIHIELAEKRVLRNCDTCGKEHREWFEVEASQGGIKSIDECVRRWVNWAERQAGV